MDGIGTLIINADGSYTFTPAPNYSGSVPPVNYVVTDGADTDVSILTVTILNAKGDSLRRRWEGNFAGASAPLVLNVLLDHLQRCSAARARKVRA